MENWEARATYNNKAITTKAAPKKMKRSRRSRFNPKPPLPSAWPMEKMLLVVLVKKKRNRRV